MTAWESSASLHSVSLFYIYAKTAETGEQYSHFQDCELVTELCDVLSSVFQQKPCLLQASRARGLPYAWERGVNLQRPPLVICTQLLSPVAAQIIPLASHYGQVTCQSARGPGISTRMSVQFTVAHIHEFTNSRSPLGITSPPENVGILQVAHHRRFCTA